MMNSYKSFNGLVSPINLTNNNRQRITHSASPIEDPDVITMERDLAIRRSQEWKYNVLDSPFYEKDAVYNSKLQINNRFSNKFANFMDRELYRQDNSTFNDLNQFVKKRPMYKEYIPTRITDAISSRPSQKRKSSSSSEAFPAPIEFQNVSESVDGLSLDSYTEEKILQTELGRINALTSTSTDVKTNSAESSLQSPKTPSNGIDSQKAESIALFGNQISNGSLFSNHYSDLIGKTNQLQSNFGENRSLVKPKLSPSTVYDEISPQTDGYVTLAKAVDHNVLKTTKIDIPTTKRSSDQTSSFDNYSKEASLKTESSFSSSEAKLPNKLKKTASFLKRFFAFLFSHIGLSLLVVGYTILGGLLFCYIEKETELDTKRNVTKLRQQVLDKYMEVWANHQLIFLCHLMRNFSSVLPKRSTSIPIVHYTLPPLDNNKKPFPTAGPLRPMAYQVNSTTQLPPGMIWYLVGAGKPDEIVSYDQYKAMNLPTSKQAYWEWSKIHGPRMSHIDTEADQNTDFDFDLKTDRFLSKNDSNSPYFNEKFLTQVPRFLNVKAESVDVLPLIEESMVGLRKEFESINRDFGKQLYKYISNEGWNGEEEEDKISWNLVGGILFAVTIITTIGYGHVTPKTTWGRFSTMLYAVFGIPLFFCYLSSNGDYMAHAFRLLYARGCRPAYRALCTRGSGSRPSSVVLVPNKNTSALQMLASAHSKRLNNINNSRSSPIERLKILFSGNRVSNVKSDEESITHLPVDTTLDSGNVTDHVTITSEYSRAFSINKKSRSKTNNSKFATSNLMSSSTSSGPYNKLKFDVTKTANNDNGGQNSVIISSTLGPQGATDRKKNEITVPISVTVSIMSIYIVIGASIFLIWEQEYGFLHWSYFCFITLSTIGFGDIVPGTESDSKDKVQKLGVVTVYVAVGLCLFAMCFKLMEEEAISKIKRIGERIGIIKRSIIGGTSDLKVTRQR